MAFASSEALRATRMALELEKRGRSLADELSDLDRRLWKMNEADLRRQIKRLKLVGKLKGAGGVLVGAGLIILTIK